MEARKNPVLLRCRLCLVKPMRASFEYHSALLRHPLCDNTTTNTGCKIMVGCTHPFLRAILDSFRIKHYMIFTTPANLLWISIALADVPSRHHAKFKTIYALDGLVVAWLFYMRSSLLAYAPIWFWEHVCRKHIIVKAKQGLIAGVSLRGLAA